MSGMGIRELTAKFMMHPRDRANVRMAHDGLPEVVDAVLCVSSLLV
jgi:hypothetical protein